MSDITQAGREARTWIAIASNASGDHLSTPEAAMVNALLGIGCALLDLTAAVREQTKDLTAPIEMPEFER